MHLPVMGNQINIRGKKFNNTFGIVREKNGQPRAHQGWDISAMIGTPVYAIATGVIEFTTGNIGDYGRQICMSFNHNKQNLYAFYAHLSSVTVITGQYVVEGEEIGYIGRTGNAKNFPLTEAHLHFEIRTSAHRGRLDPSTVFGVKPLLNIIFDDFPKIVP